MELGAFMRPKHEEALNQYLEENWKPLEAAIEQKDFAAFEQAFHAAIDMANAYHELKEKPYIRWKLPDAPPPDLDLDAARRRRNRRDRGKLNFAPAYSISLTRDSARG